MKLDGATIAIEPRSVGACIDLAVLFTGAHLRQLFGLTLCFAVPACLATYWLASHVQSGLWPGLLVYFFGTPFLGAAIVAGAGHRVFGDPFSVRGAMQMLVPHAHRLCLSLVLARLAVAATGLLCFVPAIFPAVHYGFLPEILLLEETRGSRLMRRSSDLMRGAFSDLLVRYLLILAFFGCLAVSLFSLIDLASRVLFGLQILSGRISSEFFSSDASYLFFHDPKVITLLCATLWLVYPLGRLAWFLCYLDNRIRKEAWDVELDFRIEAQRLQPGKDIAA